MRWEPWNSKSLTGSEALSTRHDLHIKNYGDGVERRLTGAHETARFDSYSYGVSDRGASVRIPWQVEKERQVDWRQLSIYTGAERFDEALAQIEVILDSIAARPSLALAAAITS